VNYRYLGVAPQRPIDPFVGPITKIQNFNKKLK
jgi:hypothetical protein